MFSLTQRALRGRLPRKALFLSYASSGLRVSELPNLGMANIDFKQKMFKPRSPNKTEQHGLLSKMMRLRRHMKSTKNLNQKDNVPIWGFKWLEAFVLHVENR